MILLHLLPGLFFSSPLHIFLGVLEISRRRCVLAVSSGVGSDGYSRDDYNSGLVICVDRVVDGWSLNYAFIGSLLRWLTGRPMLCFHRYLISHNLSATCSRLGSL